MAGVNEVRLQGRVSADPEVRDLPSGDALVAARVVVPRPPDPASRTTIDTIGVVALRPGARRSLLAVGAGDTVEVEGRLRRRFWASPAGRSSVVEVEALKVRRLAKAPAPG